MTIQQSKFLKNNIVSLSTLIVLVGFIFNLGKWQQSVDIHIKDYETKHLNDMNLHMPFEDKIKIFVPRVELEKTLKSLENKLDRIYILIDKNK